MKAYSLAKLTNIIERDGHYILNTWAEFVRMTPEEQANLEKLRKKLNTTQLKQEKRKAYKYKSVLCIENGIVFESMGECAKALNVARSAISQAVTGKMKIKGYTIRRI